MNDYLASIIINHAGDELETIEENEPITIESLTARKYKLIDDIPPKSDIISFLKDCATLLDEQFNTQNRSII